MVLFPIAAGLSALGTSLARAQSVTLQPIRMVVPFPAGGPTDIVARPFGLLLGNALKQSVVIDNRGGAGGSIGAAAVASAAPDGYTLLVGTVGTQSINPYLYKKLSYNPQKDLTPLATSPVPRSRSSSMPRPASDPSPTSSARPRRSRAR
jgi:tripartite-type tricarboxylate transporter receptor subunit TctC